MRPTLFSPHKAITLASIVEQMTTVCVFVDDYLKAHPKATQWRRSNNHDPSFSVAKVISVALLQGGLGAATLKQTHQFAADNLRGEFPLLLSYQQWLALFHSLSGVLGQLAQVAGCLAAPPDVHDFLDSKAIPVCKRVRYGRVRLLWEDGAYFSKHNAHGLSPTTSE